MNVSILKQGIQDKSQSILDIEEGETQSYKTNDSSNVSGKHFNWFLSTDSTSYKIIENDWNNKWDEIKEEDDETSSVGSGITPRRLEEDQEELAWIKEELTSRSKKSPIRDILEIPTRPEIVYTSHAKPNKNLQLS